MRSTVRFALLAAVLVSVSGCRFKGFEGFAKATSEHPIDYTKVKGDPYSDGGIADATGGLNSATRYGRGARPVGSVMPGFDQAGKGSGQQPGEAPNVAGSGHAQSNAPGLQSSPGDIGR